MTALVQSRPQKAKSIDRLLMLAAVGAKGFKGGIAMVGPDGYLVSGKAGPGYVRVGCFYEDWDNSAGTTPLAVNVELDQEIFAKWFANDTTAPIVQADMLRDAFVLDDQTVTADSNNSVGGRVWAIDAKRGVLVQCTYDSGADDEEPNVMIHRARAVVTAIAAYTAAAGILTANANGALAAQDGVTLAVGDVVLLPTDKAQAAKDAGPYVVTSAGSATSKFTLARPDWYRTGSAQPSGQVILIGGEGTAWKNNEWKATAAAATFVVDTTDGVFLPRVVKGSQALAAGAATVSNLYVGAAAQFSAVDTTAAAAVKGVLTAGNGTGSLALTGTTTDVISYVITNW